MHLSCEMGTVKPRPNFKTPTKSIKLLNHHIKAGPTLTDIQTSGGNKESLQVAKKPTVKLPIKFPTFQLLPQIILLTNQLYERRTTANESIASGRINFDNQIHCGNGRISKNIEEISGEARNKRSCLKQEIPRDSFIVPANSRPAIYPEQQSSFNDQGIFYTVPLKSNVEINQSNFQLTSQIDIDHYSILAPQLGARLLRLLVLIILHQEYIFPAKEIITLRAFTIQEELNTNPLTKNIYRTKYTEEIIRQNDQSVIIHRLTLQQKNRTNSI